VKTSPILFIDQTLNNVQTLVKIIKPPSRKEGIIFTNHMAIGVDIISPNIRTITQNQLTSCHPNEIRNPRVAEIAIANSLISTVPIIFLAELLFLDNNIGVVRGPHSPPSVA